MQGQVLLKQIVNFPLNINMVNTTINLSSLHLPSGLYVVKIINQNQVLTNKFTILK